MKLINKYKSPNYSFRKKPFLIKYVVIHYTAINSYNEAIQYLCNKSNKVSSHFLINKLGDIYYLVNIKYRAWHAGISYWKKEGDINSNSIGIELDNSGHHLNFEKYTSKQISSIIKLLNYLKKKYNIKPENILGHSDVSPYRKIDPGEKFPWDKLHLEKIIQLPKKLSKTQSNKIENYLNITSIKTNKHRALFMLEKIGYYTNPAKSNVGKYNILIKSYQMHFRKKLISGKLDSTTYELIKSHFNQLLTV